MSFSQKDLFQFWSSFRSCVNISKRISVDDDNPELHREKQMEIRKSSQWQRRA